MPSGAALGASYGLLREWRTGHARPRRRDGLSASAPGVARGRRDAPRLPVERRGRPPTAEDACVRDRGAPRLRRRGGRPPTRPPRPRSHRRGGRHTCGPCAPTSPSSPRLPAKARPFARALVESVARGTRRPTPSRPSPRSPGRPEFERRRTAAHHRFSVSASARSGARSCPFITRSITPGRSFGVQPKRGGPQVARASAPIW